MASDSSHRGVCGSGGHPRAEEALAKGSLSRRQLAFAEAILDPAKPLPTGLVGPDGEPSPRRFAVYRNNVVVGLCEALKTSFPVVRRLVGEEFFFAMARIYVAQDPPRSPMMFDYGESFPDFIGHFPPAADLAYLSDVARIERAWIEAYHAAEATPLEAARFHAIAPDELPGLRLAFHPSLRLVRSLFPALTIWHANAGDDPPEPIDLDAGGEDAIVLRPGRDVEIRSLPPGGYDFVRALEGGSSVLDALEAALAANCDFDLAACLSGLIRAGAFIGLGTAAPAHPAASAKASSE